MDGGITATREDDNSSNSPRLQSPINCLEFESLQRILNPSEFLGIGFDVILKQLGIDENIIIVKLKSSVNIMNECWKSLRTLEMEPCCGCLSPSMKWYYEVGTEIEQLDFLIDDYVWEHLNIGHWKSVPPKWRKLYTLITLLKVI
jgi:hypothetical protein